MASSHKPGSLEAPINPNEVPKYDLPVDSEFKATRIKIYSFGQPHMRAFHLAWISFFFTFLATFAPAALLPVIRENLSLTKWTAGNAGVASVVGAVVARVIMGTVLDNIGSRFGTAITLLLFAPAVFCMSLVTSDSGFTVARLFIGCSLSAFVCCQYWVGSMFNVRIVGTANAIAAGWGNMGGGATQLILPLIYTGIERHVPGFEAWRWCFIICGGVYFVIGNLSLWFGMDAPNGDFRTLRRTGQMGTGSKNFWRTMGCGLGNYRTWLLALLYGYCFGVELAVDNIIVQYLYDQFTLNLVTAGGLGALFGLMNIFSRASGGMLSDLVATRFGMRGRLWMLYILNTLAGLFCIALGKVDYTLSGTIVVMIIFSIFCQQSCGALYGIVPFVSRRAYGAVSGTVGGGGNLGAIVTQLVFFTGAKGSPNLTNQEGLVWMGVMITCIMVLLVFVHWPMWGSMLFPGNPDVSEEDYYLKEWTADEVAQGLHTVAMKFAMESRSMRGRNASYKASNKLESEVSSVNSEKAEDTAHGAKGANILVELNNTTATRPK